MNIKNKLCIISAIALSSLFVSCNDNDSFQNNIYTTTPLEQDVLVKLDMEATTKTLQASIAQPEGADVNITYVADPSMVATYNKLYNANAVALPTEYYEITEPTTVIKAGAVQSGEVMVTFKNLTTLDLTKEYVLPVSIANSTSIPLLTSKQTTYFVIKEAALINTMADMYQNYVSFPTWKTPSVLNGLRTITMEGLVNVRSFQTSLPGGVTKSFISTFMGIEGSFLIRFGDAGIPNEQIQVACSPDNVTASNLTVKENQLTHVAMTYDMATRNMKFYIDGKLMSDQTGVGPTSPINLGNSEFHISYSWDDTRYIVGTVSEFRIWNVVRTAEEIANSPYYVSPSSPGLAAYWKFDEGTGSTVHDYSINSETGEPNGNDGIANFAISWSSVNITGK